MDSAQHRLGVGIHPDVPSTRYHEDPAKSPSLSASIASLIVDRSELHAWHEHPRLNPAWTAEDPTQDMEDGTALHTLLLGSGVEIVRVGSDDWKQEWARDKRARVRADGGVPVLARRIPELVDCAAAARAQLLDHPGCPGLLGAGSAEVTLVWRMGRSRSLCRARVDWLCDDVALPIYDLKFTRGSAAPADWERHVWEQYAIQAEFYSRAVASLRGCRPPGVRFVVIEMKPPYGVSVFAPGGDALHRARGLVDDAVERWATARKTKVWPGYRREVGVVELPGWMVQRDGEVAFEREQRRDARRRKPTIAEVEHVHGMMDRLGHPLP